MMRRICDVGFFVFAGGLLAACSFGVQSSPGPTSVASAAATAPPATVVTGGNAGTVATASPATPLTTTMTPGPTKLSGSVASISSTSYGTSAAQSALPGATVVIGPTLIAGATAPPSLPTGDVTATTDANGNYAVTIASAQVTPSAAQATFVHSPDDLSGVTPPANGYYVAVFGPGADGHSGGAPLPYHGFVGVTSTGSLGTARVSTATSDEANFLALVNADRTSSNPLALPLIFDETAQEAARLHVAEEGAGNYYCHYNAQNVGPGSRYLSLFGLGSDDENIGKTSGYTLAAAYGAVEAQFLAEKSSGGGHYENIIDVTHAWAGVTTLFVGPSVQLVDQELVSPAVTSAYVYPIFTGSTCPAGVTANNS